MVPPTKPISEILHDLAHFTDTESYTHHWTHLLMYTDGVSYLADTVGAHWLLDLIATHQTATLDSACGGFQLWILTVLPDRSASLSCFPDSDIPPLLTVHIPYTDFPLPTPFHLWVEGSPLHSTPRILLLPSEH